MIKKSWKLNRIFLLLLFCILFSIAFRMFLNGKLESYQLQQASGADSIQESESPFQDSWEQEQETMSPGEQFRKEFESLSEEEVRLRQGRGNGSLKEQEQKIADLWDTELSRISAVILEGLKESQKEVFREEQKQFQRERRSEAEKMINSGNAGVTENIDYLMKYASLTEEHCYELLEKYLEQ